MTPEERDLIAGLFERMRSTGVADKDREAESYINQSVRQFPDASYMLVQSVLVQEHALEEAQARIQELEDRIQDLERGQPQPRSSGSGSFLGGLFGGGRAAEPRGSGSVPPIGSRGTPSAYDAPKGPAPWAGDRSPAGQPAAPGGGGGFMRSAMATAAGVAGGVLAADAIRGMMGGTSGQAHAASSDQHKASDSGQQDTQQDAEQEPQYQDANDNDPGNYDSDDSSWGSDDIDI